MSPSGLSSFGKSRSKVVATLRLYGFRFGGMDSPARIRWLPGAAVLFVILCVAGSPAQQKTQPAITVDLRSLGAAADLFSDESESKYQHRGLISVFWLSDDRVAVGFSTNKRWTEKREQTPLQVRLLIFQAGGKEAGRQQYSREWNFTGEGPSATTTLELVPGPDGSILAIHETASISPGADPRVPEGNFVQVLRADTSLREDFYVAATSAIVSGTSAEAMLVLQQFYSDRHSALTWWTGHPLKAGAAVNLPPGRGTVLVGPGVAARAVCASETLCSGVQIFGAGGRTAVFPSAGKELTPVPRVFLTSTDLLVEERGAGGRREEWFVLNKDGARDPLPDLPQGMQIVSVSGIAAGGRRFSLDAGEKNGLCGMFELWCKAKSRTFVIDVTAHKIVFQQEISTAGGMSALSPDGRSLAVFDKDKLMVYELP